MARVQLQLHQRLDRLTSGWTASRPRKNPDPAARPSHADQKHADPPAAERTIERVAGGYSTRGFSGYACGGLRLAGDQVAAIVFACHRSGTDLRMALRWTSRFAGLTVPRERGIVVRRRGHRGT
jgi:hypothetical protein